MGWNLEMSVLVREVQLDLPWYGLKCLELHAPASSNATCVSIWNINTSVGFEPWSAFDIPGKHIFGLASRAWSLPVRKRLCQQRNSWK